MASKLDIKTYLGNVINNQLVPTPTTRHSINPATGQPLYEVPVARTEDLDAAVDAAHKESGVGMEWGMEGLRHYTNSRSLWMWKRVFE